MVYGGDLGNNTWKMGSREHKNNLKDCVAWRREIVIYINAKNGTTV